ncbi:MAG TPA: cell division ATP-binding protein FtsE [Gammaproteobacteria bacterium]|nr:cell division ATP-binding protein FtsE [Gammaproteobacteria bacterium]
MIEFRQVTKRFNDGKFGLVGIDLQIHQGEMVFLTGHSGAGKSTLLNLITLLERPTRGEVWVDNGNLLALSCKQIPIYRRRIGVIFQDHRLLLDRNVFDNVALPLVISGVPRLEIPRRVHAALDLVNLLDKENKLPSSLSGGEQQRVGIARAVVNKPPIILADEPTGNLDPELSKEIIKLFENLNQVGVTLLIASHDYQLLMYRPYRVLTLAEGRLIADQKGGIQRADTQPLVAAS